VKQLFSIIMALVLGWILLALVPLGQPTEPGSVASYYLQHGVDDNRGANLVTSVIVNYRGFDTLGEVTVLFLSVAGASFVLRRKGGNRREKGRRSSELLQTGALMLFAPILVFGAYIFVHGHLSPGGGFQGGAVSASAVMLLLLADNNFKVPHKLLHTMESLAGFTYVMVGMAGLVFAGSFLSNQNMLPLGTWNNLFSAGLIPIIYVLVGLKVGTELSSLLDVMMETGRPLKEGGKLD
jgi:multicomponent Na+:H+ antiporter subunit B